jgi:hypothetical protein
MNFEYTSYIFFTASFITLVKNIWDYYRNTEYINSDIMGAMINWHYGFLVVWILMCSGICLHPNFNWYHGLILMPVVVFASYIFWFPVHKLLKALRLIEKEN